MIAEESTAWPGVTRPTAEGGLGFGFKWNMGWMHDTLVYVSKEPIHRQHHHHQLTFSLVYAWSENFVLPISHDEVVHGKGSLLGKMPGDQWQKLANVRALLAFMWAHPGKQLLFMGCELADDREWSEQRGLDWWLLDDPRAGRRAAPGRATSTRAYRDAPALWSQDTAPDGFRWIVGDDAGNNMFAFVRIGLPTASPLVCVANFAAVPHEDYRIGLPLGRRLARGAQHRRGASTAAPGVGNLGAVHAEDVPWHGLPASAALRVPPLGVLWLRPDGSR